MTQEWNPLQPTPEQLAAFADGQLQGTERERVEGWLFEHPDASAEVESYRRLARLWQTAPIPQPPAEAWDRTLQRIKDRLPVDRRFPWGGLAGLGAAAAILVGLLLPQWLGPRTQYRGEAMPFPVVAAQDVTIISMDAADIDKLVVARPPVDLREIAFANHDDVRLIGPADADIRLEDWGAPMIVDPQAVVATDRER